MIPDTSGSFNNHGSLKVAGIPQAHSSFGAGKDHVVLGYFLLTIPDKLIGHSFDLIQHRLGDD